MRLKLTVERITMVIASSYITLGIFSRQDAARWWWVYAIVTFVLAAVDLKLQANERRAHHERQERCRLGTNHA